MRVGFAAAFAGLVLLPLYGCSYEWKETKSAEGNFKVLFPREPEQASRDIVGNGEAGRELTMKKEVPIVNAKRRLFLVKNRLYQVAVLSTNKPLPEELAKKFFDSFALLND